jgi:hypothetical protein
VGANRAEDLVGSRVEKNIGRSSQRRAGCGDVVDQQQGLTAEPRIR